MADIFISYSKSEPEITKRLAERLEQEGFSIWWDTGLLSGDEFSERILEELDNARAVIVIWTPRSARSKWVRSEARRADEQRKLIPVHSDGIDLKDIPPPFGEYHTVHVNSIETIVASLNNLSVRSTKDEQFGTSSLRAKPGRQMDQRRIGRFPFRHECDILAGHPADEEKVGEGVPALEVDTSKALALCEAAMLTHPGEPRFEHLLGRVHYILDDYSKARDLLSQAANRGYAASMLIMGLILLDKDCPFYDAVDAKHWLERAATNGNAEAMRMLAYENACAAFSWYRKAAQRGHKASMYELGRMHETGVIATQDSKEARAWYDKASAHGNAWASFRLAQIYVQGISVPVNTALGLSYLEKAADTEDAEVLLMVAAAYDEGSLGSTDFSRAAALLLDAADMGDQAAQAHLLSDMQGWHTDTIKELQTLLREYKYDGPIDGKWSEACRIAVKNCLGDE